MGKQAWNSGKTKKDDPRLDYERPTQFKKGNKLSEETKQKMKGRIPWNKGKKGIHLSPSSEFKKGQTSFNTGKKFPERSGINHHNWKGGVTPINEKIRKSLEYKLWRTAVFERDKYTCIWCGAKSGNGKTTILQADHIKPFAQYPELRFAIDNGRTLCKECHKTTKTYGRPKK